MRKKAQPESGPPPSPPMPALDRLPLYYDGSRGPLRVTLRDSSRALAFEGPGLRLVPIPDAQDLLTTAIGGGAFFRAVPLAEVASWQPSELAGDLEALAAAGKITVVQYQPAGAEPQPYLVLDAPTRQQLARKESA